MAKKLMKALVEGMYDCSIVAVIGCFQDYDVNFKVAFKVADGVELQGEYMSLANYLSIGAPEIEYYTLKIKVNAEGSDRILTVNKFANRVVWTDSNGDGWTQLDFFTSGLQRQLGMEDETDDSVILGSADCVKLYIAPYTNPKTGSFSYNIDSTAPRKAAVAAEFDIEQ